MYANSQNRGGVTKMTSLFARVDATTADGAYVPSLSNRPSSRPAPPAGPQGPAFSPVRMYTNDLYGDGGAQAGGGDVLANEPYGGGRDLGGGAFSDGLTAQQRVMQQKNLAQQKKAARLQGGLATQGSIGTSLQPRPPTQGGLQMQPLGQPLSVGPRAPAGYTAPVGLGAAPTGSGYGQVQDYERELRGQMQEMEMRERDYQQQGAYQDYQGGYAPQPPQHQQGYEDYAAPQQYHQPQQGYRGAPQQAYYDHAPQEEYIEPLPTRSHNPNPYAQQPPQQYQPPPQQQYQQQAPQYQSPPPQQYQQQLQQQPPQQQYGAPQYGGDRGYESEKVSMEASPPGPSGNGTREVARVAPPSNNVERREWVCKPPPFNATVQCYILRSKKTGVFKLFLDDGDHFLLASKKRNNGMNKSANYLVSIDEDDLNRDSANFVGKVRSNYSGTEFSLFDNGINPEKKEARGAALESLRIEMGAVTYETNFKGMKGPRKMTALIPKVRGNRPGAPTAIFRPLNEKEGILATYKKNQRHDEITLLSNKQPKWNEALQAYCLNFNGRVTQASVKNFQLVDEEDEETVLLQFGKIGKDAFTMDFRYPLTALQAFSICLSSLDRKLVCE